MLAKILSGAIVGLDALPVTVEVDIASQGLPSFTIVGLPDKAVEESKERVRAAIKNSGAEFPAKRITVNLAPADLPKAGPAYDLPIAIGILIASGQLPEHVYTGIVVGEVSLDGALRHTNGVLSIALLAKNNKETAIFLPEIDAQEAAVIHGIDVFPVPSLLAFFHHLVGQKKLIPCTPIAFSDIPASSAFESDMADVRGQHQVKRVLEISAAGGHNVFMHGPPGAGKTMLARTMSSILPVMTEDEALDVTKIYSVTGNLPTGSTVMKQRPFRAPHHTTSRIGLIGGGSHPSPGEISLAHRGILFLDEFPEFPRHVLEALRQPMEDGIVTISRANGTMTYPAKFLFIAAANPCPCGNYGSDTKKCTCAMSVIQRYQKRISGPIMDRIDLHVPVPAVPVDSLTHTTVMEESSETIRQRVQAARDRQIVRFLGRKIASNAEMSTKMVREFCVLDTDTVTFLRSAIARFHLSARSYYRVLKVARTIADLNGEEGITIAHVAEACQYRPQQDS